MAITARIVSDSKSPSNCRLTTFVITMPRIVLAELNTHRMISKNSASSRAIPFNKMLESVQERPFIPMSWMKEHKGMQGTEYFTSHLDKVGREVIWLQARNAAVEHATALSDSGVSKQICNRLLEPFMYHTVICSATDWGNFFNLRAHDQAEIHIQFLAYEMLRVYNESKPVQLEAGQWHIPFGDKFDDERVKEMIPFEDYSSVDETIQARNLKVRMNDLKVRIASARCARISYNNFEGKDDYAADIKLFDSLLGSGHMSPFEHCSRAESDGQYNGNFAGFTQFRKLCSNENRMVDKRVL